MRDRAVRSDRARRVAPACVAFLIFAAVGSSGCEGGRDQPETTAGPPAARPEAVSAHEASVTALAGGDKEGAARLAAKVEALDPLSQEQRLGNALIAREEGRLDDAAALLEDALRIDPKDAILLGELAGIREAQKRPADATALLRRALDIEPGNEGLRARLAGLESK